MADSKRAVAALGVAIVDGDVVLTLKGEDGAAFQIRLHPGMVAGLAVGLMGMGKQVATSDEKSVTAQPMTLTASIPALGPQGQPILDLVLENGMHFPVTFPKSAIPILQNALATLQQKSTAQPPRRETKN
jgi:hypothetical protein